MDNTSYVGSCHCGALGFVFSTRLPVASWSVRSCDCSFCRAHGARCTSDPAGSVRFRISRPERLLRYRFALETADFLICGRCGVYVGAVLPAGEAHFAIVNLNALVEPPAGLPAAGAVGYGAESASERISRRHERWTPVVEG